MALKYYNTKLFVNSVTFSSMWLTMNIAHMYILLLKKNNKFDNQWYIEGITYRCLSEERCRRQQ